MTLPPPLALAEEPAIVLHVGGAADALAAVGRAAGRDDDAVVPVRLELLLSGEPALLGAHQPAPCAGLPTDAPVEPAALWDLANNRVDTRVVRQEYAEALALLDPAVASLACLRAPVEPSLGARLHLLRGLVLAELGQASAARVAFTRALDHDPSLTWPARYPADHAALLDEARAPRARGELWVAPGVSGPVFVDGRLATGAPLLLPVGEHLVQLADGATFPVLVGAEPLALVGPAAVVLGAVGTPEGGGALNVLARVRFPDAPEILVWTGGAVWQGPGAWRALGAPPPSPAERKDRRLAWRSAGLAVAAVGGLGALAGGGWMLATRGETATGSDAAYFEAYGRWQSNLGWTLGAAGVCGVGLAVAGFSLLPSPTSAGLAWSSSF